MKHPIDICKENINLLLKQLEKFLDEIGEASMARGDREQIKSFENNYKSFINYTSSDVIDAEDAISSAKRVAIHAQALGLGISNKNTYSAAAKLAAKEILETAANFIKKIDSGDEFTGKYELSILNTDQANDFLNKEAGSISKHEKKLIELQAKLQSNIETFERDIAKGSDEIEQLKQKSTANYKTSNDEISELLRTVEHLKSNLSTIHENMATETDKAAKISEDAAAHSKKIHTQIDDLLGQNASKVLLIDYANTAEAEKKSADSMRNWSLICMALTGGILCFALYESLSAGFDWKQAILKAFTAIALSVPAAYLARESAKHRNQEHINRRISLDLRAITPYIASLPSEEQNKIKSEVASKIFGVQENGNIPADNYPINAQELVKSIIEKIPTPK